MVLRGLTLWHFKIDRYFGANFGKVKDSFAVQLLPRQEDALEPMHQLRYDPLPLAGSCGEEKTGNLRTEVLEVGFDSD